ncbi:MAG: hypothetical protein RQ715_07305 [Methylococcales bacterium]|nr:hypothetical protein [Methylococcales bacterium]
MTAFSYSARDRSGRLLNGVDEDLDARLVSAGPNGVLDTAIADTDASNRNDDRMLFLRRPDTGKNLSCGDQ